MSRRRSDGATVLVLGLGLGLCITAMPAEGRVKANMVPPPVTYDAGNAVVGVANDAKPMPGCTGGVQDAVPVCLGGSSRGSRCEDLVDSSDCELGAEPGVCALLTEPDGITTGDAPTKGLVVVPKKSSVQAKKSKIQGKFFLIDPDQTVERRPGKFKFSCDPDVNANCSTDPLGYCSGGPLDGEACEKAKDCNDPDPGWCDAGTCACEGGGDACDSYDRLCRSDGDCELGGDCLSGDEWWLQCDATIGSNTDDAASDTDNCILAATSTPPEYNADTKAYELSGVVAQGVAGICEAGPSGPDHPREGLVCQLDEDCQPPSSPNCADPENCDSDDTCSCGFTNGKYVALDNDEVCFQGSVPVLGAAYLCVMRPFTVSLDYPLELKKGKGKVKVDVAEPQLSTHIPQDVPIQVNGCYLHEPGLSGQDVNVLGIYNNSEDQLTAFKRPCPDLWLPLLGGDLGLTINAAVGPIVGVAAGWDGAGTAPR